jgi:hypothetical protein
MIKRFRIDGAEYDAGSLPPECEKLLHQVAFAQQGLQDLQNRMELLAKAKHAYIADLKAEIIRGRTGVDLGVLFAED